MRRGRRNGFRGRAARRGARRSPARNMSNRRSARRTNMNPARRSARRASYTSMGQGSPTGMNYNYNRQGLPIRAGDNRVHGTDSSKKTSPLFKHPARHSKKKWVEFLSSFRVQTGKNGEYYTVFNRHATNARKLKKGQDGRHGLSVSVMNVENTDGDGPVNPE